MWFAMATATCPDAPGGQPLSCVQGVGRECSREYEFDAPT